MGYTCSLYTNVTGKRPLAGGLSGHAQNIQVYIPNSVRHAEGAGNYANPFETACRPGNTSKGVPGDSNATIQGQTGASCAPWCGCPWNSAKPGQPFCQEGFVECPTGDLPEGTTAKPQCLLWDGTEHPPSFCALVCDPSDPSGTGSATWCPKGAKCKPLYNKVDIERIGIFNTGVCMYDAAEAEATISQ